MHRPACDTHHDRDRSLNPIHHSIPGFTHLAMWAAVPWQQGSSRYAMCGLLALVRSVSPACGHRHTIFKMCVMQSNCALRHGLYHVPLAIDASDFHLLLHCLPPRSCRLVRWCSGLHSHPLFLGTGAQLRTHNHVPCARRLQAAPPVTHLAQCLVGVWVGQMCHG